MPLIARFKDSLNEIHQTLKLGVPITLNHLTHMLLAAIDTAMIGHIGVAELAAAGFANGIFAFFMVFAFGASMILSPMIAGAIGKGDDLEAGSVFRHGFIMMIVLAFVLFLGNEIAIHFLHIFKQPPEVLALSESYLRIIGFSIFPLTIYANYTRLAEASGNTTPPLVMSWIMVFINVFLNWVFIFGNLGSPAMGLFGAGLATFLSRVIILILMAFHVHVSKRYKRFKPDFKFRNFRRKMLYTIARKGFPSGMQIVNEVGAFVGATIMMGWFGTVQLAAHQVALNLASTAFMIALGISSAASIRVGHAYGKNEYARLKRIGNSSVYFTVLIMMITASTFILFRHLLPQIYTEDPEVIQLAAQFLLVAAFFQLFDGTQAVLSGVLRGLLDVRVPLWITIAIYWGFFLPTCYLLAFTFGLGPIGIWIGMLLGLLEASILLKMRFHFLTQKFLARA